MLNYKEFIENKAKIVETTGLEVNKNELHSDLFDFQKDIIRWALAKGKAAIFADCGLGKTFMQLEWANQIHKKLGGKVLILAPLAVAPQTKAEGFRFGIEVTLCENMTDVKDGINITNYEKLDKFDCSEFMAVVIDESSILKSFTGKIRNQIIQNFERTPYKLACTATPAPNDYMELGNHSEFLGVMTRSEMLSMFFTHDGSDTSKWRLKGHAEAIFWDWMCSWSVFIDNPTSLDYSIDGYDLPQLNITEIIVDGDTYSTEKLTLSGRRKARKETLEERCQAAAELVNASSEQWLVWCNLNDESARLKELIGTAVEIKGADKATHKSDSMVGFSIGLVKDLVTKPSIAGYGMNWQNCHNMVFVGLSDSYEQLYQAIRRCYRFGQKKPVNVYIVMSAKEGTVKENIERKEVEALKMREAMVEKTKEITKKELKKTHRIMAAYEAESKIILPRWEEFDANLRCASF